MSDSVEHDPEEGFFSALPELVDFRQIAERGRYSDAPGSWRVVITDVCGSTRAIEQGRYKDVNALGVASIVAVRNAVPGVELPYVFGGDGATLLVPGSRIDAVESALRGVRRIAREAFDMELRAAHVAVDTLRRASHPVRVARYRVSDNVRLAMFAGSGFAEAERRIKHPEEGTALAVEDDGPAEANLEGFECRWQPVRSQRGAIVSLLVASLTRDEHESAAVYRDVVRAVEDLGETTNLPPLSSRALRLSGMSLDAYTTEARLRSGRAQGEAFEASRRRARKQVLVGRMLIGAGIRAGGFDGAQYTRELLENTDFRKFDETLRMVLDLDPAELERLRAYLEDKRRQRQLAFGIHCSEHALVTCYVRSYAGDHVHFVDGANGGYALAAKELKAQLRSANQVTA